jgi:arylsulfatase A-like enzyme
MEKMWPYETDVRIPFYIAGPGIAAGQTPSVMGVNIDIAPTLLDLAGIKKPNQMCVQLLYLFRNYRP